MLKRWFRSPLALVVLFLLCLSCSKQPEQAIVASSGSPDNRTDSTLTSAHFVFHHIAIDRNNVEQIAASDEIHMMSPNNPEMGTPEGTWDYLMIVMVHEFTHCVSQGVNSHLPNNPRWLWESVALYEAGQFVSPNQLDYMRAGQFPTLAELDQNWQTNTKIYELGYVLMEFMVSRWGLGAVVRLMENLGDIRTTLGIGVEEFERNWHEFIREKYFS